MSNPDFISSYLKYAEGYETPQVYDLWSSISCLASLISRRVWIDMGFFKVYPHLYVVLVGQPGGRKTSAMEISESILMDVGDIMFSSTATTKEALCKKMMAECVRNFINPLTNELETYTPISLCLTELSHFLGINNAHMIDFLTTIYDRAIYKADTKNMGNDIIEGPFLNILACTTPSNITRYLKEDVISGGFSRRTIFVYEFDDGEPIAFPTVTEEALAARAYCVEWGKKLATVAGQFVFTDAAKAWYKPWYDELFYALKHHRDLATRGYYKSKHIQLLKLSMLFAVSNRTDLILEPEHLMLALATLEKAEKNLGKVYESMGRNELSGIQAKAMDYVSMAQGAILEKELETLLVKDANYGERMEIIRTLVSSSKLIRVNHGNPPKAYLVTPEYYERNNPPNPPSAPTSS